MGLRVRLFGKFSAERDHQELELIRARKVQELFGYLIIFRNRPQTREALSELLWVNETIDKSKKNLRQTLWRLQSALKASSGVLRSELLVESQWIQIDLSMEFWVDIIEFEQIFNQVNSKPSSELSGEDFNSIQHAIELYKGDLLQGWYQDWCLFERERYRTMNLMLLSKQVQHCEAQGQYEAGLAHCAEILRHDWAYERVHRQMMRLYFKVGDRTQALYQYERCVKALRDEFDVEPSTQTKRLYEQIRSDTFIAPGISGNPILPSRDLDAGFAEMLNRLEHFSIELSHIQVQAQKEIDALKTLINLH